MPGLAILRDSKAPLGTFLGTLEALDAFAIVFPSLRGEMKRVNAETPAAGVASPLPPGEGMLQLDNVQLVGSEPSNETLQTWK